MAVPDGAVGNKSVPASREPDRAAQRGQEISRVARLAMDFAKGTKWPGGALGVLGAALLVIVVVGEEYANPLSTVEFVGVLSVGALLTLVGPLVVAYTDAAARRAAVEVEVAEQHTAAAEAEAQTQKARVQEMDRKLELQKMLQEQGPH